LNFNMAAMFDILLPITLKLRCIERYGSGMQAGYGLLDDSAKSFRPNFALSSAFMTRGRTAFPFYTRISVL